MYTAQRNAHGNTIVCKGSEQRKSYQIIFTGSYNECMEHKYMNLDVDTSNCQEPEELSMLQFAQAEQDWLMQHQAY